MNIIKNIKNIIFFNTIDINQIKQMLNKSQIYIKKYQKNEIIHLQNETCNTMDIVIKGKVIVQNIDENGNIITISKFYNNDLFGANLLFSKNNFYPMTIIADSNTVILKITKPIVIELCQSNKEFLLEYLSQISNRSNTLASVIDKVARKSIRTCIIDFLRYESNLQNSKKIILNITKKELAEKFGVQRTSLSRELNKMKKENLIDFDKNTITIKKENLI